MLSLGDYFWAAIPGMTRRLWERVERAAVKKGLFSKGGYMNIKEHIREEGRQEGWEKGQKEGWEKRNREVILKMIQKEMDVSFISEVTGLPKEEIEKLKTVLSLSGFFCNLQIDLLKIIKLRQFIPVWFEFYGFLFQYLSFSGRPSVASNSAFIQ